MTIKPYLVPFTKVNLRCTKANISTELIKQLEESTEKLTLVWAVIFISVCLGLFVALFIKQTQKYRQAKLKWTDGISSTPKVSVWTAKEAIHGEDSQLHIGRWYLQTIHLMKS